MSSKNLYMANLEASTGIYGTSGTDENPSEIPSENPSENISENTVDNTKVLKYLIIYDDGIDNMFAASLVKYYYIKNLNIDTADVEMLTYNEAADFTYNDVKYDLFSLDVSLDNVKSLIKIYTNVVLIGVSKNITNMISNFANNLYVFESKLEGLSYINKNVQGIQNNTRCTSLQVFNFFYDRLDIVYKKYISKEYYAIPCIFTIINNYSIQNTKASIENYYGLCATYNNINDIYTVVNSYMDNYSSNVASSCPEAISKAGQEISDKLEEAISFNETYIDTEWNVYTGSADDDKKYRSAFAIFSNIDIPNETINNWFEGDYKTFTTAIVYRRLSNGNWEVHVYTNDNVVNADNTVISFDDEIKYTDNDGVTLISDPEIKYWDAGKFMVYMYNGVAYDPQTATYNKSVWNAPLYPNMEGTWSENAETSVSYNKHGYAIIKEKTFLNCIKSRII